MFSGLVLNHFMLYLFYGKIPKNPTGTSAGVLPFNNRRYPVYNNIIHAFAIMARVLNGGINLQGIDIKHIDVGIVSFSNHSTLSDIKMLSR